MANASDFAWCKGPGCDSGQIHEGGAEQPISKCQICSFRTCFYHQVAWHERLTCEEYDELQRDPDGFQSRVEKEEAQLAMQEQARAAQEREDAEMARVLAKEIELEEQKRVRNLEQEVAVRSRAEAAEAMWRREAEEEKRRRDAAEDNRRREEEEERKRVQEAETKRLREAEAKRLREAAEKAKQAAKQKARDEAASLKMISSITKKCPGKGCGRPIEKNEGCAHMTCKPSVPFLSTFCLF